MYNRYEAKRVNKSQLVAALSKMRPGGSWPWVKVADGKAKNSPLLCIVAAVDDFNDILDERENLLQENRVLKEKLYQLSKLKQHSGVIEDDIFEDLPF